MTHLSREKLQQTLQQLKQLQRLQKQRQSSAVAQSEECGGGNSGGSGGGCGGGGGSGGGSVGRTRRMMRRHLSARRTDASRRPHQLQRSLYRFLDERQNSSSAAAAAAQAAQTEAAERSRRERERRRLLLEGLGVLRQMSLGGSTESKALNSASNVEARPLPPAKPRRPSQSPPTLAPQTSSDLVEDLHQLSESLRYLELACRVKTLHVGGGGGSGVDCGVELTRKVGATRRLVADLLRRCSNGGGGGGGSVCRAHCATPAVDRRGDPLFWCCPAHTELRSRQLRNPAATDSEDARRLQRRRRGRSDAGGGYVRRLVSRAKAALIGDPVFRVDCTGKEFKWGQMTVPATEPPVLRNSADSLGLECLHRRRMRQHGEAAEAQIREFAGRVEDKWEAIEDARIGRAIDAACRRLRRAIRLSGRRRSSVRAGAQEKPKPTAAAETAGNNASDTGSIQWGI